MTKAQNDEWTLGGHSFTSRFILGSGKYSMDLIEAAVACAGAQIITLALRRVSEGGKTNILDYIPKESPCSRIRREPGMQKKPFGSHVLPERPAAAIL